MNTVDSYLKWTRLMTDNTIVMWEKELNTSGNSFNFDSQDIYRQYMINILMYDFKDKVESAKGTEERIEILSIVRENLETIIKMYERNSDFFTNLDRDGLRLKKYREKTKSNLSDNDLTFQMYRETELPERKAYFESDFYKEIGFLNYDYHQEIYNHSKRLLKDVKSKFEDYEMYDNDYLFINDKPIFSMGLISKLHSIVNNQFIEDISEYDFYREINILHTVNKIKIKEDFLYTFFYVIHCLHNNIENKSLKKKWFAQILKEFKIKKATYDSKYKHITGSSANDTLKEYRNLIDSAFKQ
ncbi:hypothetical protein [Myroides odoratimimus]|uniref:hypothetical protein n=1 Tax=Myroides odoratimimus TaxID=76832 RepID=UPI0009134F7E|nr:hypothetical protein [Myroides odoratimimus]SHM20843.1 hypothetical protein SAMN05444275_11048 [Myroides odoratimimus subsp. xuanwuensis]